MPRPLFTPVGRLDDLRTRPDAELLAYTTQGHFGETAKVTTYASRAALEAFCKPGSSHHALIKTRKHPNLLTNRNTERPE